MGARAFVGDRGAGDGLAPLFEWLALIRPAAHRGVQSEAGRIGAEAVRDLVVAAAPLRKLSVFCPARGPKAMRYVHEAACNAASG